MVRFHAHPLDLKFFVILYLYMKEFCPDPDPETVVISQTADGKVDFSTPGGMVSAAAELGGQIIQVDNSPVTSQTTSSGPSQ